MTKTSLLMIKLTDTCPNKCIFCLNGDGPVKHTRLNLEEIKEIVKKFDPKKVEFTGGEPLIDISFLIKVIKELRKMGVKKFRINTALDLKGENNPLTCEDIRLLGKIGSVELFVSIETLNAKKYSLIRNNTHALLVRVLENISFFLPETDLLLVPGFVPTSKNINDFPEVYSFISKLSKKYPNKVLPLEFCKLILTGRATKKIAVPFKKELSVLKKLKIIHPIEAWCYGKDSLALKKIGLAVHPCSFGKDSFYVGAKGAVFPDNSCGKSPIAKHYSKFNLEKYLDSDQAKGFFCLRAWRDCK